MEYSKYQCRLVSEVKESKAEYHCQNPADIYAFLRDELHMEEFCEEHLIALYMNNRLDITGYQEVSIGTKFGTYVDPSPVFRSAILSNAAFIILAHNHPSGDPSPSGDDIATTKRMVSAGEILGISVKDHLIVGNGCYISLHESGQM